MKRPLLCPSLYNLHRTLITPPRHPGPHKISLIDLGYPNQNEGPFTYSSATVFDALQRQDISSTIHSYPVNRTDLGTFRSAIRKHLIAMPQTDIASGSYIWNTDYIKVINDEVAVARQDGHFDADFILGGPMATYTPRDTTTTNSETNFIAIGFSEYDLTQHYLDPRSNTSVISVTDLDDPQNIIEADRKRLLSFKSTPMATYLNLNRPYLFDLGKQYGSVKIRATLTQVGCAFRCSFCQWPGGGQKREFVPSRLNDVQDILVLEKELRQHHIILDVSVNDAIFNSGTLYLTVLDAFINGGFQGKLSLQCRPEMIEKEFLDRIVTLTTQGAMVLLEFGIQTYNRDENKAIQRNNNFKKIEEKIALIQEVETAKGIRIPVEFSLIYGLPLQTVASFKHSIFRVKQISQSLNFGAGAPIIAFPLSFLPGTALTRSRETYEFELSAQPDTYVTLSKADTAMQEKALYGIRSSTFTFEEYQDMTQAAITLNEAYDTKTRIRDEQFGIGLKKKSTDPGHLLIQK